MSTSAGYHFLGLFPPEATNSCFSLGSTVEKSRIYRFHKRLLVRNPGVACPIDEVARQVGRSGGEALAIYKHVMLHRAHLDYFHVVPMPLEHLFQIAVRVCFSVHITYICTEYWVEKDIIAYFCLLAVIVLQHLSLSSVCAGLS